MENPNLLDIATDKAFSAIRREFIVTHYKSGKKYNEFSLMPSTRLRISLISDDMVRIEYWSQYRQDRQESQRFHVCKDLESIEYALKDFFPVL
jgi:hypothetical protein